MRLAEFSLLREEDQWELLSSYEFIATREDFQTKYFLYQIDSFYIEVMSIGRNKRLEFRTFSTTNLLEPYLMQIDISDIANTDKT
jgi:hypothetical protein